MGHDPIFAYHSLVIVSRPGNATITREHSIIKALENVLLPCNNPIYLKRVEFGCGAPKLPSLVPPLYRRDSAQSVYIGEVDGRRRKKNPHPT